MFAHLPSEDAEYIRRRLIGGYGTGEGAVGLVENHVEGSAGIAMCQGLECDQEAVLYFVDSAEAIQRFACLRCTPAIAYDVATASTSDPDIPAELHGPDTRRWPSRNHHS